MLLCKHHLKLLISMVAVFLLVVGCADNEDDQAKKEVKSQIAAFSSAPTYQANQIRTTAIKDTARSIGAQAGLAWTAEKINTLLQSQKTTLAKIYDFQALMLDDNVMPPVLAESKDTLNLDNDSTIRLADHTYQIIKPPHFVTTIPSWRSYLWMNFPPPEIPNDSLLPKNNDERDLWNKYLLKGWNEGIIQGQDIFEVNLNLLTRDYNGMILYRKLLAENMVTPPYVSKADLGITGGGDNLRVNDQVLRITATSQLKANSQEWVARIYPVPKETFTPVPVAKQPVTPITKKKKPVTKAKSTKQKSTTQKTCKPVTQGKS